MSLFIIQFVVLTTATDGTYSCHDRGKGEELELPALIASKTLLTDEPRASDRRREAHAANSAGMDGDGREGV